MSDTGTRTPRRVRARRLLALGTVAATGLAAAQGEALAGDAARVDAFRLAQASTEAAGGEAGEAVTSPAGGEGGHSTATQGGEGGEGAAVAPAGGEGGESGAAIAGYGEDTAYLTRLDMIEGHLRTAMALLDAGNEKAAWTHTRHPRVEIYESLEHDLEARGAEDFGRHLDALSEAVEKGASRDQVETLFQKVLTELDEARERAGGGDKARVMAIVGLARQAAKEYDEGVKDGTVEELVEYQDAWGFLQAARARATALATSDDPATRKAAEKILAQIEATEPAFKGIEPEAALGADPSLLYGAAARMELAAYQVK